MIGSACRYDAASSLRIGILMLMVDRFENIVLWLKATRGESIMNCARYDGA